MKFIDLLIRLKAMLEETGEVPPGHTGEITVKLQLNQGGIRDGQLIVSKSIKLRNSGLVRPGVLVEMRCCNGDQ